LGGFVKLIYDNHWWLNRHWRRDFQREVKLRQGFAIGPIIVLFKEKRGGA
jgi:hypothetical protein